MQTKVQFTGNLSSDLFGVNLILLSEAIMETFDPPTAEEASDHGTLLFWNLLKKDIVMTVTVDSINA